MSFALHYSIVTLTALPLIKLKYLETLRNILEQTNHTILTLVSKYLRVPRRTYTEKEEIGTEASTKDNNILMHGILHITHLSNTHSIILRTLHQLNCTVSASNHYMKLPSNTYRNNP